LKREIQRRKFEATLKPQVDAEVERWHKSQPSAIPPPIQIDNLHIQAPWHDKQQSDHD
jgi:hypothetical protein